MYRPNVVRIGSEEAPLAQRAKDVWVDGLIRCAFNYLQSLPRENSALRDRCTCSWGFCCTAEAHGSCERALEHLHKYPVWSDSRAVTSAHEVLLHMHRRYMSMSRGQWQHDSAKFQREVLQLSRAIMETQKRIKAASGTPVSPVSTPLPVLNPLLPTALFMSHNSRTRSQSQRVNSIWLCCAVRGAVDRQAIKEKFRMRYNCVL